MPPSSSRSATPTSSTPTTLPLAIAPLATQTRRTYSSKARQYLAWLSNTTLDSDPLASPEARDWAVRDYRSHLQAVAKAKPATVNNALAAIDDLYTRRGLGPARAVRVDIPDTRHGEFQLLPPPGRIELADLLVGWCQLP